MTLPHGFGSHDEPPTEKLEKCKLGQTCTKHYGSGKCYLHAWTYRHDDAWVGIKIIIASIIGITILVFLLGVAMTWDYNQGEPIRRNIEGYNCDQLAEYIADKSSKYSYAEHRYEWLCVNEQIKEFQG